MPRDVRNLLRHLDAPKVRYRDLHATRAAPRRARRFSSIAVAGSSALAGNLADAFAARGLRVAAFELDPHRPLPRSPRVTLIAFDDAPAASTWELAVIDAGARTQPLADADEALIALRPRDDPTAIEAMLAKVRPSWRKSPARYVLEQLDAGRPEDRAGLRLLRARLGPRLLEPPVHYEPAGGALFPPESQAAADIAALARALFPAETRDV